MKEERVALVTGGNKGIGLEVSRQLGMAGVRVVIGARDVDRGTTAAAELKSQALMPSASSSTSRTNGASLLQPRLLQRRMAAWTSWSIMLASLILQTLLPAVRPLMLFAE